MDAINSLYKNKELLTVLVSNIKNYNGKQIKIMEVCGTHTMAISKHGIRAILPDNIKLISGPGCPVCVTPNYYINAAIELSNRDDIIIATFGDMMRIPAKNRSTSLLTQKAIGRDIKIVYSPLDCIDIAQNNKDKKVVFLSVGFETTTPVIALSVLNAAKKGINNYMILSANKTIPNALKLLAEDKDITIDGFIYPGHVSAIIGEGIYHDIAKTYGIPGVIAGFEAVDILGAVNMLINSIEKKEALVDNLYKRVVNANGNEIARDTVNSVFKECDSIWRGIGEIPNSGLELVDEYKNFDAWQLIDNIVELGDYEENSGCLCGDILKGKCVPSECKLFGRACTPESPVGSCMVSSEGTCAAYYKYQLR